MKINPIIVLIFSIITTIGCFYLNISEFVRGADSSWRNFIATLLYIFTWLYVLVYAIKNKNKFLLAYNIFFWCINFAVFWGYTNELFADLLFVIIVLFGGQWYGSEFIFKNIEVFQLCMLWISLLMVVISSIFYKFVKR